MWQWNNKIKGSSRSWKIWLRIATLVNFTMLCRVALPRKLQARYVMTTINLQTIRPVKKNTCNTNKWTCDYALSDTSSTSWIIIYTKFTDEFQANMCNFLIPHIDVLVSLKHHVSCFSSFHKHWCLLGSQRWFNCSCDVHMIVTRSLKTKINALYEGHICPVVCACNFISAPKSLEAFHLYSTLEISTTYLPINYNFKIYWSRTRSRLENAINGLFHICYKPLINSWRTSIFEISA